MAEQQIRRRRDRFLLALFALIGAALGFLLFFILNLNDPTFPVTIVGHDYVLPGSDRDATLTVTFFGRYSYTKTAPSMDAFRAEILFLSIAPLALSVLVGAFAGGLAGYCTDRWLPRTRR